MREIRIKDDDSKRKKSEFVKKIKIVDEAGVRPEQESEAENEFEVQPIEGKPVESACAEDDAKDYVKVKFGNFVQLIVNHDFRKVIEKHVEEEIVMKTNLLTDLANAHSEEGKSGSWPIILAVGIVLGIIAAYVLFKFF